ncbi:MAG: hypothetical protein IPK80_27325 [Nannocystis sp.]|nr:hypothetical protein [Nannocystis sp.]
MFLRLARGRAAAPGGRGDPLGHGSDGTAGARPIKERGGLVLVQDPSVARFDSMPKSVIDAGLADIIATVEAMPQKILGALRCGHELAREPVLSDS